MNTQPMWVKDIIQVGELPWMQKSEQLLKASEERRSRSDRFFIALLQDHRNGVIKGEAHGRSRGEG